MAEVSLAPFARNASGQPATRTFGLGRVVVKIAELDANDDPDSDGWEHLGNAPMCEVTATRNFIDHYSSMAGVRDRDVRILIEELLDGKLALEAMTEAAARLFFSATPAAYTNVAIAGYGATSLTTSVLLGRSYPLQSTTYAFGIDGSDLSVTQHATEVTAAVSRTLTFATADDTITASSGSFVTDGFRIGQTLVVAGTSNNNGSKTITNVSALIITVSDNLTDEGPLNATATLNASKTLTEDTDYTVDEQTGEVTFLTTSTYLEDGDIIKTTLAANASAETTRSIPVLSRDDVTVAMRIKVINGRDDEAALIEIPKVTITPDGSLPLVTAQELMRMPLSFSALKKDADTPLATIYALPPGGVT